MINPICNRCSQELEIYGGLAFSPPEPTSQKVDKIHLCVECWDILFAWRSEKMIGLAQPDNDEHTKVKAELEGCGRVLRHVANVLTGSNWECAPGLLREVSDALNSSVILKDQNYVYHQAIAQIVTLNAEIDSIKKQLKRVGSNKYF